MLQFLFDARRRHAAQTWLSVAFACGAGIVLGALWHANFNRAKLDAPSSEETESSGQKSKRRKEARKAKQAAKATFKFVDTQGHTLTLTRDGSVVNVNVSGFGDVGEWKSFDQKKGLYHAGGGKGKVPKEVVVDLLTFLEAAGDAEDSAPDLEDLTGDAEVRPNLLGDDEVFRPVHLGAGKDAGESMSAHVPGAQRVHVKIYGCQHNQSDGEYMMGQLRDYGYTLVDSVEECDCCVVNSCTVKNPSESRGLNAISDARNSGKAAVLAGCVPSGDKKLCESSFLDGVSMIDVSQLDRIVEVVEESLKGHTVKLLEKRHKITSLSLPKIRRDNIVEIIPINVGCFGNCTYCKTKFARGSVVSHPIADIVERAKQVASEGVRMIELASEDMGAYGIDLGTNIVELLLKLSDQLPEGVMVRTGMTNPPFIMQHIDGIVEALKRPNIFSFMHIPVQSGSNDVLRRMKREYTVEDFSLLCDRLRAAIPDIYLITDIICGFPAESDEDWAATMELCRKYRFHGIYSSKFFARPGTPAFKMKQQKAGVCSDRYKDMVEFASSWNRNEDLSGKSERVWFYGTEAERGQTIGRTKAFAKVVVPRDDELLGRSAMVRIDKTCVAHVEGVVLGDLL